MAKVKSKQTISCPTYENIYTFTPPFVLECTASSGLPVQYERISGPVNIVEDTIKPLGAPGKAWIRVKQPGNENYEPAKEKLLTILFSSPSELTIAGSVSHVSCNGKKDGKIDVSVGGGTSPYSFSWSNDENTEDISGLDTGSYTVTVTDDEGTSKQKTFEVKKKKHKIHCEKVEI